MHQCWKMDTPEQKEALLTHAQDIAHQAIRQYDIPLTDIRFNQISDTITFIVETEVNQRFLLRIYSNLRKKSDIFFELQFLAHLKEHNLAVPAGQQNSLGDYVLEYPSPEYGVLHVTLMDWIEGKVLDSPPTTTQVMNTGRLLARLHLAGTSFQPNDNIISHRWDVENFRQNMNKLAQYYECFLSENEWDFYQDTADKIITELKLIPKDSLHYGVIHGDFHMENVVFRGEDAFPIDFGRCGYGYYANDIAGVMVGLGWQNRKIFMDGYLEQQSFVQPLNRKTIHATSQVQSSKLLETMFVMIMIENYCHHCSNHDEIDGLIAEQPHAQAYMRAYLEGRSFLFEKIEL